MPTNPPPNTPTDEMFARAWHAFSDETVDGVAFDDPGCTCRNYAPQVRDVFGLFTGRHVPEPDGIGAIVVNPLTDKVYVRHAHPGLPWHNPDDDSPQHWSDPTCDDRFEWKDLPRPLVVQSPGWTPPPNRSAPMPEPRRFVPEPTGIGAVVVDTADDVWVRFSHGQRPWLKTEAGLGQVAAWDDLDQPVSIRNHGWQQQ